jgi:tape measure domain-containing protein
MADNQASIILRVKDEASRELRKTADEAKNVERNLEGINRVANQMGNIGKILSVSVTTPLAILGGTGVKSAMQLEVFQQSLNTLIGDAEAAKSVFEELYEFDTKTTFNWSSLTKATTLLAAFNVEAEDIVPTLGRLGDIAAAVQMPIDELADSYGRMRVSGRVTMNELNQLMGRGIPIVQELAKNLGVTESEILDMASTGRLSFADIERGFQTMTDEGGRFFGMMESQTDTTQGRLMALRKEFEQVTDLIGEFLIPYIDKMVSAARRAVEWFVNLDESTQGLYVQIGLLVAGIGPLTVALSGLPSLINGVGIAWRGLQTVVKAMSGPVGWITLAVTAVAGLVAILSSRSGKTLPTAVEAAKDALKELNTAASSNSRESAIAGLEALREHIAESQIPILDDLIAKLQDTSVEYINLAEVADIGRLLLEQADAINKVAAARARLSELEQHAARREARGLRDNTPSSQWADAEYALAAAEAHLADIDRQIEERQAQLYVRPTTTNNRNTPARPSSSSSTTTKEETEEERILRERAERERETRDFVDRYTAEVVEDRKDIAETIELFKERDSDLTQQIAQALDEQNWAEARSLISRRDMVRRGIKDLEDLLPDPKDEVAGTRALVRGLLLGVRFNNVEVEDAVAALREERESLNELIQGLYERGASLEEIEAATERLDIVQSALDELTVPLSLDVVAHILHPEVPTSTGRGIDRRRHRDELTDWERGVLALFKERDETFSYIDRLAEAEDHRIRITADEARRRKQEAQLNLINALVETGFRADRPLIQREFEVLDALSFTPRDDYKELVEWATDPWTEAADALQNSPKIEDGRETLIEQVAAVSNTLKEDLDFIDRRVASDINFSAEEAAEQRRAAYERAYLSGLPLLDPNSPLIQQWLANSRKGIKDIGEKQFKEIENIFGRRGSNELLADLNRLADKRVADLTRIDEFIALGLMEEDERNSETLQAWVAYLNGLMDAGLGDTRAADLAREQISQLLDVTREEAERAAREQQVSDGLNIADLVTSDALSNIRHQISTVSDALVIARELYGDNSDEVNRLSEALSILNEEYEKTAQEQHVSKLLEGYQKLRETVNQVFDGVSSVLSAVLGAEHPLTQFAGTLEETFNGVMDVMSNIASGNWVGAIVSGVKTVIGFIKSVMDWFKPEWKKISEEIERTLNQSVVAGISNAIREYATNADMTLEELREALKRNVYSAVLDAIIGAIVQGAIIEGALKETLKAISDAAAKGDWAAVRAGVAKAGQMAMDIGQKVIEASEPLLEDFRQVLGSAEEVNAQTQEVAQFGQFVSQVIAIPFYDAALRFEASTLTFSGAVDRLVNEGITVNSKVTISNYGYVPAY